MRLFLGVELPADIKFHVDQSLTPLRISPKGWENPADYHLTLLFIGEASEEDCSDIIHRMQEISFLPFTLTLDNFRFFPRRVMYLAFRDSAPLLKLKDQVENKYSEWVRPNQRPYIPHVTVKRWQRYEYEELIQGLEKYPLETRTFAVRALALFKSEKDSRGQKYHVIFRKEMKE